MTNPRTDSPRRMSFAWLSPMVLLCIVLAGCGGQQAPASQAQRYQLKGTVISIDRPEQRIVVDHEEIKGFMAAMAMPYPVSDPKLLDVAGPGDQITAEVVVTRHFGASGEHRCGQEGSAVGGARRCVASQCAAELVNRGGTRIQLHRCATKRCCLRRKLR